MRTMRIFGIDPAPGKKTTIFDEEEGLQGIDAVKMSDHLIEIQRKNANVLLCWDAPLTGVTDPTRPGNRHGDYTMRHIEKFFRSKSYDWKAPVSVQPYAQCQHWTISRALLGLPRVGLYDKPADDLLFRLCANDMPPKSGHNVVEVHPALAIWIWLLLSKVKDANKIVVAYKSKKNFAARQKIMTQIARFSGHLGEVLKSCPGNEIAANDDALDAFVAYSLGWLWIHDPEKVMLLGNAGTGAFLLPRDENLKAKFAMSNLTSSRSRQPLTQLDRVECIRALKKMGMTDREIFEKTENG